MVDRNLYGNEVTKVMREDPQRTQEIEDLKNKTKQQQQQDPRSPQQTRDREHQPAAGRD